MSTKPVLILKTGATLPEIARVHGDFHHWFTDAMALAADDVAVADARTGALPAPGAHRAVVITGSPAMVTSHEDWIEEAASWLRQTLECKVAVLGVCFGHQLLAYALGGEVGANRHGREMGTVTVSRDRAGAHDALLRGSPKQFAAHMTHEECVLRLPATAARLASTELDHNAAFSVPGKRAWGVQFHPEFDAAIMRGYIQARADKLSQEGLDVERLLEQVRDAPEARKVLHRFAGIV